MKYLALLAVAWLTACSSTTTSTPSPANQVFALKTGYAAALTAAVAYKNLPACAATVTTLCSEPGVVADMRHLGDKANAALNAAEASVRSGGNDLSALASAATAIAALQGITAIHTGH